MKDIMARLTKEEKRFITKLREFDIFALKDMVNNLEHLSIVTKYTEKNIDMSKLNELTFYLQHIVRERERDILRKIVPQNGKNTIKKVHTSPVIDNEVKKDLANNDLVDKFKNRNFRNFIK